MKGCWTHSPLFELCEVFVDGDWIESKDQSSTGIRLVQTGNVGIGFFKDRGDKARYISLETYQRLRCTEIHEGDCLISRLPEPVGRACIIPDIGERMITSVDCTIVRLKADLLLPDFLVYYSQSDEYLTNIAKVCTGTTRNRISRSKLGVTPIPVPPLSEQHRIVEILDKAFADIAKAKANAERNLQNARELFESKLNEVFTKKGEGWEETALGHVCELVRGPFGGSLKKSMFVADGYAVYEQQHAIYDQFDDVRYFIDESKFKEMKRFELRQNDLLMSCSGTMGRVAIVPKGIKRGIINQALLKLTPSSKILNTFLKSWMESEAFQYALKEYSGGAAIQNVASVKVLKEIKVPLPSISDQKRIVEELNALAAETQRLARIYQRKLEELEALKKSILHKAFSGEL